MSHEKYAAYDPKWQIPEELKSDPQLRIDLISRFEIDLMAWLKGTHNPSDWNDDNWERWAECAACVTTLAEISGLDSYGLADLYYSAMYPGRGVDSDVIVNARAVAGSLKAKARAELAKPKTPTHSPAEPVVGDPAFVAAKTLDGEKPKRFLFGWHQILDAIGLTDDKENRGRVSRLNKLHAGPIIQGGQGKPPIADDEKLMPWWNSLETLHAESVQRVTDKEATISESYEHGREGEVVPDIAGHVQKRRVKR